LETHIDPLATNPALHVNPHDVPSHVAVALAGTGQAVHEDPQLDTSALLTQALPQTCIFLAGSQTTGASGG
jgi:hypothetical protein